MPFFIRGHQNQPSTLYYRAIHYSVTDDLKHIFSHFPTNLLGKSYSDSIPNGPNTVAESQVWADDGKPLRQHFQMYNCATVAQMNVEIAVWLALKSSFITNPPTSERCPEALH